MASALSYVGRKVRALYDIIFHDAVLEGSRWTYISVRFDTFIRNLRRLDARPRVPQRMVIRNRLGVFQIDLSTDSLAKANPYFEHQLHSWIPMSNKTFIDIGANIGFYSFLALKKRGYAKALAFEPNPETFATLAANIRLNALDARMTAEKLALGNDRTELRFKAEKEHTGASRIITRKVANPDELLSVQQTTFDDYVREHEIDPAEFGYLKIDVEGFEKQVLEGASNTLKRMSPGTRMQVEIWSIGRRKEWALPLITGAGFVHIDTFEDNYLFEKR